MKISPNPDNTTTITPSNYIPGYTAKENINTNLNINMDPKAHSSITYNSQDNKGT